VDAGSRPVEVLPAAGAPGRVQSESRASLITPGSAGPLERPLDVVVWNVWGPKARAMADLGDDDWRRYVCVEPGRVSAPERLGPGERWTLGQTLRWD